MADARFKGFADSFCRERFGYAYDGDVGSFAPRPSGGLFDALLKCGDILCHNALRCSHSADSSRVARLVVNRVPHRTQSRMPPQSLLTLQISAKYVLSARLNGRATLLPNSLAK